MLESERQAVYRERKKDPKNFPLELLNGVRSNSVMPESVSGSGSCMSVLIS